VNLSRRIKQEGAQSQEPDATSGKIWIRALSTRIGSESEPPKLVTEMIAVDGAFEARSLRSLFRARSGSIAKTPRSRGEFSASARRRADTV